MNLTQLIKSVLDEAYLEIAAGTNELKDVEIKRQLDLLTQSYGNLMAVNRTPIDYSNPATRFAYIYKYTIAHADYVMQMIRKFDTLNNIFAGGSATVSCLGGGPGSDLLGVLKYLLRGRRRLALTCYLFDRERAWGDSWSEVAQTLETDFPIYPVFQQLDVTDQATWSSYKKFLKADLFTLSYFMSEVWNVRDAARPFFDECFRRIKSGAKILFIDNNDRGGDFVAWFEEISATNGISILHGGTTNLAFSIDEEKTDLGEFYDKFGWPKRTSNLVYRVAIKP